MSATIIESPIEVSNRLGQLGWSETELTEIVHAMVAARNGCTRNDPVGAPGWMSWKDGIRRTREIGAMKGLRQMDIDQVPWTVDMERCLKFTVVNASDSVGTERDPQNRSKKGIGTERQVHGNAEQFALAFPDLPDDDATTYWPNEPSKLSPGICSSMPRVTPLERSCRVPWTSQMASLPNSASASSSEILRMVPLMTQALL
jgi:hypothetical protein